MTQQMRALAAFAEDLDLVFSTHKVGGSQSSAVPVPVILMPSACTAHVLHIHTYIYIHTYIHAGRQNSHKKINIKKFFKRFTKKNILSHV